jgi:hypothetical protein
VFGLFKRWKLLSLGADLSRDLRVAADKYDARSTVHLILSYEVMTIDAYRRWLAYGTPVSDDLRASSLLGEWGRGYSWDERELLARTAEFYRLLERYFPEIGVHARRPKAE